MRKSLSIFVTVCGQIASLAAIQAARVFLTVGAGEATAGQARIVPGLLLATLVLAPLTSAHAQARSASGSAVPCGCGDRDALLRRGQEAMVAMRDYSDRTPRFPSGEMTTLADYLRVQREVLQTISRGGYTVPPVWWGAEPVQGLLPSATLDDCSESFSATVSPCLLALLRDRQQVLTEACKRMDGLLGGTGTGVRAPWVERLTRSEWMSLEMAAYNREWHFFLEHLPDGCPGDQLLPATRFDPAPVGKLLRDGREISLDELSIQR
ncbi:MAG: hypothetical protein HZB55_22255 [Deltaproteobacteria bacterium]|nr:hypothetical protein [Deltaproteobacteria bacterium]